MNEQLDLPSWSPPCRVFLFPLAAWTGRVRKVAGKFRGLQPAPAVAYWRKVAKETAADLKTLGIDTDQIGREIEAFQAAVMIELDRLNGTPAPAIYTSGDAA